MASFRVLPRRMSHVFGAKKGDREGAGHQAVQHLTHRHRFNAEFERSPEDVYNRDIVTYMVLFSYYYKNRILGGQKLAQ